MINSTAGYEPQFSRDSRRLWSLWDMMQLNASSFYEVTNHLTNISVWINAGESNPSSSIHRSDKLIEVDKDFAKQRLGKLTEHLHVLGAQLTAIGVSSAIQHVDSNDATWGSLSDRIDEIRSRLKDELTFTTVFALQRDRQRYFSPEAPIFGEDVANKFVSAAFDLDEAGKCYALGRPVACVFHLMRIMEIGIRAMADCLGVPDPTKPTDRNWGEILKKIKASMDAKWPKAADRMDGDGKLFEELYASLDAVKNPWRNETMHVEGKFTDDEAEHIFAAVKGFMKKMASRMDEKGEPKI